MAEPSPTIKKYLNDWLSVRRASKSVHTFSASKNAAMAFLRAVGDIPLPSLTEEHYSQFLRELKHYNARTEQLYSTLIFGWFVYLGAKDIKQVNLAKLKYARENEQRRPGGRLRRFDRTALEQLKQRVACMEFKNKKASLPIARAKAIVILAIDSGLRVSELCGLRIGNLDLENMQGTVVGKRDKERLFFFTTKSVKAIRQYMSMRQHFEPNRASNMEPLAIPVFVSHSKRGHSKLEPIETDMARLDLVSVLTTLGIVSKDPITPHVLRHFAGNELRKATGDLQLVSFLLGHKSIETTKGYMHVEEEEAMDAYRRAVGDDR